MNTLYIDSRPDGKIKNSQNRVYTLLTFVQNYRTVTGRPARNGSTQEKSAFFGRKDRDFPRISLYKRRAVCYPIFTVAPRLAVG